MSRLLIGAITLVLAFSLAGISAAAEQWQTVSVPADGFVVQMPGHPKTKTEPTEMGGLQGTVSRYEISADDAYWGISAASFGTPFSKSVPETLDMARDRALNAAHGQIRDDKAITMGTVPGRELVYFIQNERTNNHRMVVRQRIYMIGKNKLVQQAYIGTPGSERSQQVNYFFNSIKLNP